MKKYILSYMVSFVFSLLFCYLLIPLMKKLKTGQNILKYVKEHEKKEGTPTMGGLAFIFAAVLATLLFEEVDRILLVSLTIGVSYLCVGLLDDLLKKKHKENLGLKAWQKFAFQTIVAVFAGIFCFRSGLTSLHIPFIKVSIDVGFWIIPISIFVFLATVNGVNLTDGLDGLATSSCLPFFATLGVLCSIGQLTTLSVLSFTLVGALSAYLLFNSSPASIFMGDTGSLSLGGLGACIGIFSGNALYIAVVGITFVFSVISVMLQVIYYKATGGKRIFLMAPVHHHFQQKGYSETKISYAYFSVTLTVGLTCILFAI